MEQVKLNPQAAIIKLLESGKTTTEISTSVGIDRVTVWRIRHGKMAPTWEVGNRIVSMAQAA